MAFSSTDLSNIEAAMIELATGKRVVETSIAGKVRQFQSVDLDKLQRLRNIIKSDVNASSSIGFFTKVSFKNPT